MGNPVQICYGFSAEHWRQLREKVKTPDEEAWRCAVEVFQRRINERFMTSIKALEDADTRLLKRASSLDCANLPSPGAIVPGFAIIGLCCLLIETLATFRADQPKAEAKIKFRAFLRLPAFGNDFTDDVTAGKFVHGVRNAILHNAETRHWTISRNRPKGRIVEQEGDHFVLNRVAFRTALTTEFNAYMNKLRDPDERALRKRFVRAMDRIVDWA